MYVFVYGTLTERDRADGVLTKYAFRGEALLDAIIWKLVRDGMQAG